MSKTLRPYQEKIHNATKAFIENDEMLGQIYAPTGAGKTVLFNKAIEHAVELGMRNFCVVTPRIALSQQQVRNGAEWICGIEVVKNSFNSGAHPEGYMRMEINTTNASILTECINSAMDVGNVHITYASYDSFTHINDFEFDLVIADEGHYLAQKQFRDYTMNLSFKTKCLLYTATPVVYENGEKVDMHSAMNESMYGRVLAEVLPYELYKDGYIVPPAIIELHANRKNVELSATIVDILVAGFVESYKRNRLNGMPHTQMLVCTRDVQVDITTIQTNVRKIYDRIVAELPEVAGCFNINTVSSKNQMKDGNFFQSREALLKDIQENQRNCIVAHYDTLAEGIDISTLSAVLFMSEKTREKLIQSVGRCARPYIGDLTRPDYLPDPGKFSRAANFDIRQKRECLVIIPVIDHHELTGPDAKQVLQALVDATGYQDLMTVRKAIDPGLQIEVEEQEREEKELTAVKKSHARYLQMLRAKIV
jgi:superfamily II DNA or RNA helicase